MGCCHGYGLSLEGGGDNGETSVNIGQLDRVGRTTRGEGVVQGFEG